MTIPNLPLSIPILQHGLLSQNGREEEPWNPNLLDGSPHGRDKRCQLQWQTLRWFCQKIDAYHQALQQWRGQATPTNLRDWLARYRQSKDIRKVGLCTLTRIQNNVPVQFHEILCAMVVQHAIFYYTREKNSFDGVIQSAFTEWRLKITLSQTEQKSLDMVFECLTSSDRSTPEDARPTWNQYQMVSNTFSEIGRQFTPPDFYPQTINDNSLSETPPTQTPRYNLDASPLQLRSNFDLAIRPDQGYLLPFVSSQPPVFNHWFVEGSVTYSPATNTNGSFSNEASTYSPFIPQPRPPDMRQSYEPSLVSNYPRHVNKISTSALCQSAPFAIVTKFIDDFIDNGSLFELFSHAESGPPHTRVSEDDFFDNVEAYFFNPLRTLLPGQEPLAQAIVSAAWSYVSLRELRSFKSTADYMIHLSKNLLSSRESCVNFARIVSETCFRASADRGQYPVWDLNQITADFRGAYYPAHLFPKNRSNNSRGQQQKTSRSRSSQPTASLATSSGRNGRSLLDSSTETSTTYGLHTAQSSVGLGVSQIRPRATSATSSANNVQDKVSQCPICDTFYTGPSAATSLSRHKRTHQDAVIQCPLGCPKSFKGKRTDNIRVHCRTVHGQELPEWKVFSSQTLPSDP